MHLPRSVVVRRPRKFADLMHLPRWSVVVRRPCHGSSRTWSALGCQSSCYLFQYIKKTELPIFPAEKKHYMCVQRNMTISRVNGVHLNAGQIAAILLNPQKFPVVEITVNRGATFGQRDLKMGLFAHPKTLQGQAVVEVGVVAMHGRWRWEWS